MGKEIFLTFDDGPNEYTLKILEVLKNFGARATFFVCGKNVQKFPEILKKIFEDGQEIGNHSFSHSLRFFFDFKNEIKRTNEIIKKIKPNSIILFHDCLQTSLALPKILGNLKKEGYAFSYYSNFKRGKVIAHFAFSN